MRFTRSLLALAAITPVIPGIKPIDISDYYLVATNGIVGHFDGSENTPLTYKSLDSRKTIKMVVDYYQNGTYYARQSKTLTTSGVNVPLNILDRTELGPIQVKYKFTADGETHLEYDATLVKPSRSTYYVRSDSIRIPYVCFGIFVDAVCNEERYDFKDTNEYISIDDRSVLDLSEFSFNYYPKSYYSCESAYLKIVDYENVYPYLRKIDRINTILIPLSFSNYYGNITFKYNREMYVNVSNFEMRETSAKGFVKTDSLYVPIYSQEKMSNNELSIVLMGSGFDESEINIPLRYFYDGNYLGYCGESDYCIHGGIRS